MIFRREAGWTILGWFVVVASAVAFTAFVVALVISDERQRIKKQESEREVAAQPKLVPRCPAGFIVHDGSYGYGNKPICLPGVMPTMETQP